jgi:hypothetical protein
MDWKEKIGCLLQEDRRKERRVDTARRKHIDAYLKQRRLDAKIAARVRRGGAPRHVQQTYAGPDERKGERRIPYATRVRNRPTLSRKETIKRVEDILSDYSGQKKS